MGGVKRLNSVGRKNHIPKIQLIKDLQMLKNFKALISATLTIVFALGVFFTVGVNSAKADSLKIQTGVQFTTPSDYKTSPGTTYSDIAGSPRITFTVAGKTCTFAGSAGNNAPQGCNYDITVAPNGSIAATYPSAPQYGNCTAPASIASSCK